MIPAAARIPAWRMPPPNCFRMRLAFLIKSREPHNNEPAGAHNPLLKQNVIESAGAANSRASTFNAADALKMRAPSRCTFNPYGWTRAATDRVYATETGTPPHRLCVFSRITNLEMG